MTYNTPKAKHAFYVVCEEWCSWEDDAECAACDKCNKGVPNRGWYREINVPLAAALAEVLPEVLEKLRQIEMEEMEKLPLPAPTWLPCSEK